MYLSTTIKSSSLTLRHKPPKLFGGYSKSYTCVPGGGDRGATGRDFEAGGRTSCAPWEAGRALDHAPVGGGRGEDVERAGGSSRSTEPAQSGDISAGQAQQGSTVADASEREGESHCSAEQRGWRAYQRYEWSPVRIYCGKNITLKIIFYQKKLGLSSNLWLTRLELLRLMTKLELKEYSIL